MRTTKEQRDAEIACGDRKEKWCPTKCPFYELDECKTKKASKLDLARDLADAVEVIIEMRQKLYELAVINRHLGEMPIASIANFDDIEAIIAKSTEKIGIGSLPAFPHREDDASFIPVGHEYEMKGRWAECDWGMGLAGMGRCSGGGNPRDANCQKFSTEASDYNPEAALDSENRPDC